MIHFENNVKVKEDAVHLKLSKTISGPTTHLQRRDIAAGRNPIAVYPPTGTRQYAA